jgi:uncharacterized protein (TIGR02246 family)
MNEDERLQAVEAQLAILRLIADYAHGFDKRDREVFASVWHDGAEWVPVPEITCVGVDQILQTTQSFWDSLAETHHWSSNPSISVDGDVGAATVDVFVVLRDGEGNWYRASATYRDRYERRQGRWALTRREAETHHQEPLPQAETQKS